MNQPKAKVSAKVSACPSDPKTIVLSAVFPDGLELSRTEHTENPRHVLAGLRFKARHNPEEILLRITRGGRS